MWRTYFGMMLQALVTALLLLAGYTVSIQQQLTAAAVFFVFLVFYIKKGN